MPARHPEVAAAIPLWRLRREPRRDSLATIEAAGMLVGRLEGRPEIEPALIASFERMLSCYREAARDGGVDAAQGPQAKAGSA